MLRVVSCVFLAALLALPARASVVDYCKAYARDFANANATELEVWQRKFDSAEAACLYQYTEQAEPRPSVKPAEPARPAKPAKKLKPLSPPKAVAKVEKKAQPAKLVKPVAVTVTPKSPVKEVRETPVKAVATAPPPPVVEPVKEKATILRSLKKFFARNKEPDLSEGSKDWLDYCARKYVSFDRKTGMYLSRTGVLRKCKVTSDFQ